MLKTQTYQLNQWEKSDRIMMEDFNRDNVKLETALNAIWETFPLVKLISKTLSEETTRTDLDLSGIDLADYRLLQLYVRFPSGTIPSYYLAMQVNGLASGYYDSDGDNDKSVLSNVYINRLMATANTEIDVGLYLRCSNRAPITADQVKTLNLTGMNNLMDLTSPTAIPAGTKITLYGLRG